MNNVKVKSRARGTRKEFVRLCDWLRTNHERLREQRLMLKDALEVAGAELAFNVTPRGFRDAQEVTGVTWEADHYRKGSGGREAVQAVREEVASLKADHQNLATWAQTAQRRLTELEQAVENLTAKAHHKNGARR